MADMIFLKASVPFLVRIMLLLLTVVVESGTGMEKCALLVLNAGSSMLIKYAFLSVIFARPQMIMGHALLATVVMT